MAVLRVEVKGIVRNYAFDLPGFAAYSVLTMKTGRGKWSEWRKFPQPRQDGLLIAPFGAGCYELRHPKGKLILFGHGRNLASRMTTLLPRPFGASGRNNKKKSEYVWKYIGDVEYRTATCASPEDAKRRETEELWANRHNYIFPT